jgi:hypothetical protein
MRKNRAKWRFARQPPLSLAHSPWFMHQANSSRRNDSNRLVGMVYAASRKKRAMLRCTRKNHAMLRCTRLCDTRKNRAMLRCTRLCDTLTAGSKGGEGGFCGRRWAAYSGWRHRLPSTAFLHKRPLHNYMTCITRPAVHNTAMSIYTQGITNYYAADGILKRQQQTRTL